MDVKNARRIVCEGGRELLRLGLVAGTWGNVSCRTDEGLMVITPSGIPYERLGQADMVPVGLGCARPPEESGGCLDPICGVDCAAPLAADWGCGNKPSSEAPMHAAIYRRRPEAKAIIHFHSLYACAVSAMGEEVPPYLEDMAQIIGPSIRLSGHALTGSPRLSENVVAALDGRFGALMENHGAVCLGRSMEEAFAAAQILEKACHIHVLLKSAGGGGKVLSPEQAALMRDFYLKSYRKSV